MKYKTFAVCDIETSYAEKFSDYVREHGNIPFDIHVFTDLDELRAFMQNHPIEILLLAEQLLSEDTPEWPVGTVVLLREPGAEQKPAGIPGVDKYQPARFPVVDKYQSARTLIREIMEQYGEDDTDTAFERILKPECRVIGVYSPLSGCLKTTFAIALGQILAKEKPVLYINLEEFSGMEQLLHEKFDSNMADLIYLMRQKEKDLISRLASVVGHIAALDFIPPCISGQELRGVTAEEWHRFIREIIEHSSYEAIILDLGNGLGRLDDLLTECSVIYMPVGDGIYSDAKLAAFDSFLKMSGLERIAGRIRRFHISASDLPESRDRYLQQIVWSGVGGYAKDCIHRDAL